MIDQELIEHGHPIVGESEGESDADGLNIDWRLYTMSRHFVVYSRDTTIDA